MSVRKIYPLYGYHHEDGKPVTAEDEAIFEVIRSAGMPVPNPVSYEELGEMLKEAKLLLRLKIRDPNTYREQMRRLEQWIQPKVEPDSTTDNPQQSNPVVPVSDHYFRVDIPGRDEINSYRSEQAKIQRKFVLLLRQNPNKPVVQRPHSSVDAEPNNERQQLAPPVVNQNPPPRGVFAHWSEDPQLVQRLAILNPPLPVVLPNRNADRQEAQPTVNQPPVQVVLPNMNAERQLAQPVVNENPPPQVVLPNMNADRQEAQPTVNQPLVQSVSRRRPNLRPLPSREYKHAVETRKQKSFTIKRKTK